MAAEKVFTVRPSRASAFAGRHQFVSFRAALMEAISRQRGDYKSLAAKVKPTLPVRRGPDWVVKPADLKRYVEPVSISDEHLAEIEQSDCKQAIMMMRGARQEKRGVDHKKDAVVEARKQVVCEARCTPLEGGPCFVFKGMIDLVADGTVIEVKTRMGEVSRQNEYDLDQLATYVHATKAQKAILREILSSGEIVDTEYSGEVMEERWTELVEALKRPAKLIRQFDTCSQEFIEELRKNGAFSPLASEF